MALPTTGSTPPFQLTTTTLGCAMTGPPYHLTSVEGPATASTRSPTVGASLGTSQPDPQHINRIAHSRDKNSLRIPPFSWTNFARSPRGGNCPVVVAERLLRGGLAATARRAARRRAGDRRRRGGSRT